MSDDYIEIMGGGEPPLVLDFGFNEAIDERARQLVNESTAMVTSRIVHSAAISCALLQIRRAKADVNTTSPFVEAVVQQLGVGDEPTLEGYNDSILDTGAIVRQYCPTAVLEAFTPLYMQAHGLHDTFADRVLSSTQAVGSIQSCYEYAVRERVDVQSTQKAEDAEFYDRLAAEAMFPTGYLDAATTAQRHKWSATVAETWPVCRHLINNLSINDFVFDDLSLWWQEEFWIRFVRALAMRVAFAGGTARNQARLVADMMTSERIKNALVDNKKLWQEELSRNALAVQVRALRRRNDALDVNRHNNEALDHI
jgi:hypothetical protein